LILSLNKLIIILFNNYNIMNNNFHLDYKPVSYFKPEFIFNNNLILRISFKIDNEFIPMSFICDSTLPSYFYLSKTAKDYLNKRIKFDELTEYIEINSNISTNRGRHSDWITYDKIKIYINNIDNDQQMNIIGLKGLMLFGMYLTKKSFNFSSLPEYL